MVLLWFSVVCFGVGVSVAFNLVRVHFVLVGFRLLGGRLLGNGFFGWPCVFSCILTVCGHSVGCFSFWFLGLDLGSDYYSS